MQRSLKAITTALLVTFASLAFVACGGGSSGGGGGGGGGEFLQLSTEPSYGVMGTTITTSTFNVMTPSTLSLVGPNDFTSAGAGETNFIEFHFNTDVLASSILGTSNGTAGIVVRNSAGNAIPFFTDSTGAIDATNTFPAPGIAPATLRLYFESAGTPGVPIALTPDKYTVSILTSNLKSGDGSSFCAVKDSGLCLNDTNVVYHFTLDGMNSPGGSVPLTSGPTVALPLPTTLKIDDEIRLFLSDHVDFQSVVGFDPTIPQINTTTFDPFISRPFVINAVGSNGANIRVDVTLPGAAILPPNYGYIVYMPDPFRDPSEIRIRFVDITNLSGLNDPTGATTGGTPFFQNYALPSAVWKSARLGASSLTPPIDANPNSATFGMPLELPSKLSLPGSTASGNTTVTVQLFDSANGQASDSSAASGMGDGTNGVTDRARRGLNATIVQSWIVENGPALRDNPEPPDLHLIANGNILDGIDTAGAYAGVRPGASAITGSTFGIADPLDDLNVLTTVRDIAFGAFVNPGNTLTVPPRRLNRAGILAQKQAAPNDPNVLSPGVPFPPGGKPENDVNNAGAMAQPTQPLGLRLYVVDDVRGRVQVLNSNTFQPIATLSGISSPKGVGIGGTFLYVSNFDQNTLTRVGIAPAQVATFHKVVSTTSIGPGPTVVSVQPGNEDVLVINSLGNSFSLVDVPNFKLNATFPVGAGATDLYVSNRWTGQGTTNAYQAYVTNRLSNTVTAFESDTPIFSEQNGPFGKVITSVGGFQSPNEGCYNLLTGPANGIGAQGALVANAQGSTVSYLGWVAFGLAPSPGIPGPPSFRTFMNVIEYASSSPTAPTDATIEAGAVIVNQTINLVLAMFPAAGQVASIDFNTGVFYGGASVPGTRIFSAVDE